MAKSTKPAQAKPAKSATPKKSSVSPKPRVPKPTASKTSGTDNKRVGKREVKSEAEKVATGEEFMEDRLAIPSTEPPDNDDEHQGEMTRH